MQKIVLLGAMSVLLQGCMHCTNGGQWSSYYTTGDGRCSYFCADPEEKYCGKTPSEAERKMFSDPAIQKQMALREQQYLIQDKKACVQVGFKPDTDGMATCLLLKQQNRSNNAHADAMEKRRRAESSNRSFEQGILNSRPKSVTCTTIGGVTTCR